MSGEMPIRDQNASQSTWSDRAFQSALPPEWIVHPLADDYGIDRRVEIVDGTRTTGLFFNVQLKSKRTGPTGPQHQSVKRSTLNYWDALAEPTLIVIAHRASGQLWYQWTHLLPYDSKPETQSRRVRCESELCDEHIPRLREEVSGFRLARELPQHLPVPVEVTGSTFYGEPISKLNVALSRRLSPLRAVVRPATTTGYLPRFEVAVEDARVMVRVVGGHARQLTWDLRRGRDYSEVAAELIAALGMAAADVGAELIARKLLVAAADDSMMLSRAESLPFVIALLTRHDESQAVLALMRRSVFEEGPPDRSLALAAFSASGPSASLRRIVSFGLRDSARKWAAPGKGLYNAAGILGEDSARQAVSLYDEAALHEPDYLRRGYWWREKGSRLWALGDAEEALECYRHAMTLGDDEARAYAADVLMRTGRYSEARDAFRSAPIFESPHDARWRFSLTALDFIIDDLEITEQARPSLAIPDFKPSEAGSFEHEALAAISEDAMNGSAHFALSIALPYDDPRAILAAITAAVTANTNPFGWLHLLNSIMNLPIYDFKDRLAVAHDAMVCAWSNFGPQFSDIILDAEDLTDEARSALLDFFETVQPERAPFQLRIHQDGGTIETVLIPVGKL